ncbi:MAG: YkvA family protein, partial [bacterium]
MRIFKLLRLEMLPVVRRLPAYTRLALALAREPALRWLHKAMLLGGVAYLVSPIDLIPGFIPVLGQLDDLAVALWSLRAALRAAPPEVAVHHLTVNGLTWEMLDDDLARIGRSGRLLTRAGVRLGQRALQGVGRELWHVGRRL